MRFLIDAQLPPALARFNRERGHEAEHVADLAMEAAIDLLIWRCAIERSAVLISKDADFVAMRALHTTGPPLVWLRVGNTTRDALLERIAAVWPDIVAALERGDTVIEVA